jgi:hypothetical protein
MTLFADFCHGARLEGEQIASIVPAVSAGL